MFFSSFGVSRPTMTKRFLFIGDVHIKTDNRDDIQLLLTEILHHVADSSESYDAMVLGGDVMHYHERLFTTALNSALHFIQTLSTLMPVYVLVGNHDYINNSQFLTDHHWMNVLKTWKNVQVIDRPLQEDQVMWMPYVPPGRFVEALETLTKRWNYAEVIFAHQEFRGCKMGAVVSTEGDEWDDEYPLVISGHIHDYQTVGKKIIYPGTPIQHAFGDSTVRRLCTVEVDAQGARVGYIDLNVPKKHILTCAWNEVDDQKWDRFAATDKVKLKVEATPEQFTLFRSTATYKSLLDRGVKVHLLPVSSASSTSSTSSTTSHSPAAHQFLDVMNQRVAQDEEWVQKLWASMLSSI